VVCVDGPEDINLVDDCKEPDFSTQTRMSENIEHDTKNKKGRTYLTKAEKDVLQELLPTWTEKENKRSREAFINSTVIPRIQELNLPQFSQEVISRDKEAKKLWEKRIQASIGLLLYRLINPSPLLGHSHLVQKQQTF